MNVRQRNSSIELLRITSMFVIIFYHYSIHGMWLPQGVDFSYADMSWQYLFIQILGMGGRLACDVFMLITGYYMITSTVTWKRVIKLVVEMFFYAWVIDVFVYGFRLQELQFKAFIKSLVPIIWGNWYCVTYIGVCLLIPFMNQFLNYIDKSSYKRLIVVLMVIWSVIPTITTKSPWLSSNVDTFLVMYIVGGYIKLHGLADLKGKYSWKKMLAISILFLIGSVVIIDGIAILLESNSIFYKARYFREMNKLPAVCVAIAMFMIAIENKSFYNKFVNKIATSILGIYLIHDNELLAPVIWGKWFPNADYLNSNWIIVHAIVKVVLVFIICLVIDQLRMILFEKTIDQWIDRKWPVWTARLKKVSER